MDKPARNPQDKRFKDEAGARALSSTPWSRVTCCGRAISRLPMLRARIQVMR